MKGKIDKTNVQEILELSPFQKGILFHFLKEIDENLYNVQLVFRLEGSLDVNLLQQAFSLVQSVNEALRSVFRWENVSKPLQIILKEGALDFRHHDLSHNPAEEAGRIAKEYLTADRRERFDLNELPLRVRVIRKAPKTFVLSITYHHILHDGWSNGLLMKELMDSYRQLRAGEPTNPPAKVAFKAVREALQRAVQVPHEELYWKQYLRDCKPTNLFPETQSNLVSLGDTHKQLFITTQAGLESFASRYKVTKAAVVYAACGILLYKYLQTSEVVFGTTVSNRNASIRGVDQVMGNFINTLPLRLIDIGEKTLQEVVYLTAQNIVDRSPFSNTAHFDIKRLLGLKSGENLYDVVIAVENYPLDQKAISQNDEFSLSLESVYENTSIPLVINVFFREHLEVELMYKAHLVGDVYAASLAGNLMTILNEICLHNTQLVRELPLTLPEAEALLLDQFNSTTVGYPADQTIIDLFERQAMATPSSPAFRYREEVVSYQELQARSDQMAAYLRAESGVQVGDLVGIMLSREEQLLPALLGVLKAGAAYVPIDPAYPAERIGAILADARPKALITRSNCQPVSVPFTTLLVNLDSVLSRIEIQPPDPSPVQLSSSSSAYVIYTSGSTGKPKGVVIGHQSLVNYVTWAAREYVGSEKATFALYTSISFDLTVTSIFTPLVTGNNVIVYGEEDRDALQAVLANAEVNVIKLTPSHLKIVLDTDGPTMSAREGELCFIVGGEDLPTSLAKSIWSKFEGRVRIYNEYGPTEATVGCMVEQFDPTETTVSVPIGRPAQNTRIYLLNDALAPVPAGVEGQLYIAGEGLAKGYLNNDILTNQRFVLNPFEEGGRMYQTGDQAVRCFNGRVLFRGRSDEQVKVKGFRIELGEIESCLADHPLVKASVATAKEKEGDKFLVAYYESDQEIDTHELREYLSDLLPHYMLPTYLVRLARIPLTPNGKLDRKALPTPKIGDDEVYVAPSDQLEEKLVEIWSEILKQDRQRISVTRSFLDLGGHSLKIILMLNRVFKELHVKISINELFKYPDIIRLARHIRQLTEDSALPIHKAADAAHFKLSSAQKRIYFLYETDRSSIVYNGGLIVLLKGDLDQAKIERAFQKLIARHEVFRTCFVLVNEEPVQKVISHVPFQIEYLRASKQEVHAIISKFVRPFDLSHAPLLRVGLIAFSEQEHLLIADVHHIIGDEMSQEILIREFMVLYNEQALPPLSLQYKDYAEWQQGEEQREEVIRHRDFWINEFSPSPKALQLPTDFTRPPVKRQTGNTLSFELGEAETRKLKLIAEEQGVTLFMLLLSVYNVLLSKLSGEQDLVVGVSMSGRLHPDLDNMIGLFINTLPLRNRVDGQMSFTRFLAQVKANVLTCFDQQYPYEELIDVLKVERDTSRNPLFDVMLVYRRSQESTLSIPGLSLEPFTKEHTVSKFDLSLIVTEGLDSIDLEFEYATSLFKRETIERFASYLHNLITAVVTDLSQQIGQLELLNSREQQLLLYKYNDTRVGYPSQATVVSLFAAQAAATPQRTALYYGDYQVSYQQVDLFSDRLAAYLRAAGAGRQERVGLLLERQQHLAGVLMGVLKSGAAYVPLDPASPPARLSAILRDAGARLLVTQTQLRPFLEELDLPLGLQVQEVPVGEGLLVINLQGDWPVEESVMPEAIDSVRGHWPLNTDIAYVIYTSGSTGQPKGVLIQHAALSNYLQWAANYYVEGQPANFAVFTSLAFDLTVTSLYVPLITGGELIVFPQEDQLMAQVFTHPRVRLIKLTPSHLSLLAESELSRLVPGLKLIVGGEQLEERLAARVYEQFEGQVELYNEYGPTEATVGCMIYHYQPGRNESAVPIGKPIANMEIYLLDEYLKPVPIGVSGQLYIGGVGLAQGYLKQETLTNEKFIANPFRVGERCYHTGDTALWLSDGEALYVGRSDEQVKVRGYRVELGEVQSQLAGYPGIIQAVVLARWNNQENRLVAYYLSGQKQTESQLRAYLLERLPNYMVPSQFVHLEQWPLTPNGKLDKNALLDPQPLANTFYTRPANETQRELVEIWASVLDIPSDSIGVHTNFYDVGGNSLKMIRMTSRVNKHFNAKVSMAKMFELAAISSIAAFLDNTGEVQPQDIEADNQGGLDQMNESLDIVNRLQG